MTVEKKVGEHGNGWFYSFYEVRVTGEILNEHTFDITAGHPGTTFRNVGTVTKKNISNEVFQSQIGEGGATILVNNNTGEEVCRVNFPSKVYRPATRASDLNLDSSKSYGLPFIKY